MQRLFVYLINKTYDQLVRPVLISVSPINEVALGMGIGMFVGLTPTVGIQMWIVFILWLFAKYILKIRFDLIIGSAIVWINNPFTMFFMYYGFLITGRSIYSLFGYSGIELSYNTFSHRIYQIVHEPSYGFFQVVWESTRFLIVDLGKPMLIGSLCFAIPAALISYFLTYRFLLRYRQSKAAAMGMDYETWRKKFEKSRII